MSNEVILQAAGRLIAKVESRLTAKIEKLLETIKLNSDALDAFVDKECKLRASEFSSIEEALAKLEASTNEALAGIVMPEPATLEELQPIIEAAAQRAVEAIPAPEPGRDGASVTVEDVRPLIEEEIAKAMTDLPPPQPGEKGEPGQDRPLIEPVVLKQGREYPKNTVGTFAGGLWMSTKHAIDNPAEDPHAWHCLLAGIDGLQVKHLGPRAYQVEMRLANGEILETDLRIPSPLHRGIYKEGETYTPGDMVTKGRAMFHCMKQTDHAPPGNGWEQVLTAQKGGKGDKGDPAEIPREHLAVMERLPAMLKELEALKQFFTDLQDGLIERGSDG